MRDMNNKNKSKLRGRRCEMRGILAMATTNVQHTEFSIQLV